MKIKYVACLLTFFSYSAYATLHLDPQMTGKEYRNLLDSLEKNQDFIKQHKNDPLVAILVVGKRNLDWIELINQYRNEANTLELTTPELMPAFPIESPGYSNRTIILEKLAELKKNIPSVMGDILFGEAPLTNNPPVEDETFIQQARIVNRIYEMASRWLLEEPYLSDYTDFARDDIRGYYFLSKENDLENKLVNWHKLNSQTQQQYSDWLINECMNSGIEQDECQNILKTYIATNIVNQYHNNYIKIAQDIYNHYFELQNPRPEIIWYAQQPDIMDMPFLTPTQTDVQDWFKSNVEDEFHLENWSLKINYRQSEELAKIIFEPGATPHVNKLGGNTITMDANRALDEYAVKWTIRHEFAHILGLPDCYVEFYDKKNKVMINYQIDITNLMCSRRGHLQKQHYDQLKKYYFKD